MPSDLDRYGVCRNICAYDLIMIPTCVLRQIAQLIRCEIITEEEVNRLCIKAREILIEEANVQVVDSPVTVRCRVCNPSHPA